MSEQDGVPGIDPATSAGDEGDLPTRADPLPNRRERNKERTRAAIEHAAFELFLTQGFDHTTAEQIADHADVSLRTFFRYFPTKEQVVFEHWATPMRDLSDCVARQPSELPAFEALRRAYAEFAAANPYGPEGEHRQMVSIFLGSPNLRGRSARALMAWERAVSSGLERRPGSPSSVDPELVGAVLGAALKWATRRCMRDSSLDLHEQVLAALGQLDERVASAVPVGAGAGAGAGTGPTTIDRPLEAGELGEAGVIREGAGRRSPGSRRR